MSRTARTQSSTNVYHVILRGNNKQQIFLDDEDNTQFMKILLGYKQSCDFMLLAYCLMGNHLHLLIKNGEQPLSSIMKKITVKFVYYYNIKYQRVGHLFQDRYKSEPVETETYLLQVVRYIHNNPIKAELCQNFSEYAFSSYNDYFDKNIYCDTDYLLNIISLKDLKNFHNEKADDDVMDITKTVVRVSDNSAVKIINTVYKDNNITNPLEMPKDVQIFIAGILRKKGLSVRQIARLTGISYKFAASSE